MQNQNIVNKRIELENIEQVLKIIQDKQQELENKAKEQNKEINDFNEENIEKFKISFNKIHIEIHYKDGMKISKDNSCSWLISEMYTNRLKIERIWINYYNSYYKNYRLGGENRLYVEEYTIWIGENSLEIGSRSENCDDEVYSTVNKIRSIFMSCPDKYDNTIKGKFFRSQALYLTIGLAISMILVMLAKISLMHKHEIITLLNNKWIYLSMFIFTAEFFGTLIGNVMINSMYKSISPRQKYVGYNKKTHTSNYVYDVEQYKLTPEIMIGNNTYHTNDRLKIEKMFRICKKIVLVELLLSVVITVIFFSI